MTATNESTSHRVMLDRLRCYLQQYYDLDGRLQAFEERRFYSLEVELTNRCNLECRYCYNSSAQNCKTPDLPFDFVKRLISEAREAGIRQISWLGGEPLLYHHLTEVLKAAHLNGIENILYTNGSLLTPRMWRQIGPHVSRLVFHLDTIDPTTFAIVHSASTVGQSGMLFQIIDNLDAILDAGFDPARLCFYIVLARPTLKGLRETLCFALQDRKVGTTSIFPMIPVGRTGVTVASWVLSPSDIRYACELRAQEEGRPELLLLGPSEYCKHYQATMAYVDIEGRLLPYAGIGRGECSLFKMRLGDALAKHYSPLSFVDLFSSDGRNRIDGPCGQCENNLYCFGTRTSCFNLTGSIHASDPLCWWREDNAPLPAKPMCE